MPPNSNDWGKWSKYVLLTIERLDEEIHELRFNDVAEILVTVNKIHVEIGKLQVKAGVWGLLGGAIPVVIGLGIWLLTK